MNGGDAFVIWVDRIDRGLFEDTNRMFVPPDRFDLRVEREGTPEHLAEQAVKCLRAVFDPKKPTALFVGRYPPFHEGHHSLIVEGLRRVGQACIAVRNTHETDTKNPFDFEHVRSRIEHGLRQYEGRFVVIPLLNITNIFCRREVGYAVKKIDLHETIEGTLATNERKKIAAPR